MECIFEQKWFNLWTSNRRIIFFHYSNITNPVSKRITPYFYCNFHKKTKYINFSDFPSYIQHSLRDYVTHSDHIRPEHVHRRPSVTSHWIPLDSTESDQSSGAAGVSGRETRNSRLPNPLRRPTVHFYRPFPVHIHPCHPPVPVCDDGRHRRDVNVGRSWVVCWRSVYALGCVLLRVVLRMFTTFVHIWWIGLISVFDFCFLLCFFGSFPFHPTVLEPYLHLE